MKLKPCQCGSEDVKATRPFQGFNNRYPGLASISGGTWVVCCDTCGLRTNEYVSAARAGESWNFRPREVALQKELESVKQKLAELEAQVEEWMEE
jgi:hypothetical protein